MAARPQAPHKVVDGQCYTVNFWRVSFGDVGKAHGFLNTSNIDAYNTPVAGGRQRCGGFDRVRASWGNRLLWKADAWLRSVRPLVQAATDQDAKTAGDRIGPAIDWDTVRMIGRLAAHLVGHRYE